MTYKTPLKGLQLIGEYLYASETAPIAVTAFPNSYGNQLTGVSELLKSADWQGFAGYAVYDLNDNVEFATRFERFRDGQGVRSGLRQTLFEVTETLNYKVPLVNGVLARLEYRHDASNQHPFYSNDRLIAQAGGGFLPSHANTGQDTLQAAAVYQF